MKKVLVVGASGGIGRVVAKFFLDNGYYVYGTNFKNSFTDELLNNKNFRGVNVDLCSLSSVDELRDLAENITAVINCAGVVEFEKFEDPDENLKIWQRTMAVNLSGAHVLYEKLKSKIIENGIYIMLSSTDANYGGKVTAAYSSSKAGVNSLTKSLAIQFPDSKVRVNTVAPGWVETAMMEAGGDALVKYASEINPMKRNGSPKDVAELVDFLISEKSSYINGQVITLDGGYTLQDPTLIFEEQQVLDK